jgi:hypothetical protein
MKNMKLLVFINYQFYINLHTSSFIKVKRLYDGYVSDFLSPARFELVETNLSNIMNKLNIAFGGKNGN